MKVKLQVFANLKDPLADLRELELPDGSSVADLRAALLERFAGEPVAEILSVSQVAVDDELVEKEHELRDGDQVLLLPPASGG